MNTNILTILNNLVSQKSGGRVTVPSNNNTDGVIAAEESNSLYTTTDNSAAKNRKPKHPVNSRFNDTLQKQLHSEIPELTADTILKSIPKNEKTSTPEHIRSMVREIPYGAFMVPDPLGQETKVQNPSTFLSHANPEMPQNKPLKIRPILRAVSETVTPIKPGQTTPLAETEAEKTPIIPSSTGKPEISENQMTSEPVNPETAISPDNQPRPIENGTPAHSSGQREEPVAAATPAKNSADLKPENTVKTAPAFKTEDLVIPEKTEAATASPKTIPAEMTAEAKPQPMQAVGNKTVNSPIIVDAKASDANISQQASVHKMNVAMEQVNTLKDEKRGHLIETKDFGEKLSHCTDSETDLAGVTAEKSSVTSEPAKTAAQATAGLVLGRQIRESVNSLYRPGTQQIVVRLDPPELGRVTIRFIEHEDGITGILHVEKSQTRHEIQQALPEIVQNLQQSQVQVKKIEVAMNYQQQFTDRGEHFHDGNGGFDRPHAGGHSHENDAGAADIPDILAGDRQAAESTAELTDKSINVLI